jgi:hypothetical protein
MFKKWAPYPLFVIYCLASFSLDIFVLKFWAIPIGFGLYFKLMFFDTPKTSIIYFLIAAWGWPMIFVVLLSL